MVRVVYFASLRDRAGSASTEEVVPPGATAASLWEAIRARPAFQGVASRPGFAVNGAWAGPDAVLADGDELGLLPAVSGG